MDDPELQKMFLSGGVTNILTLGLFFLLKIVAKRCDRNKSSDCTMCGASCHTVSKDTIRDAPQPGARRRDLEKGFTI